MLDHPNSGRYYACTISQIKEGACINKTSKSGATVKVCSCHTSDYCNFKFWPMQENSIMLEHLSTNLQQKIQHDQRSTSSHNLRSSFFYTFALGFFTLLLKSLIL